MISRYDIRFIDNIETNEIRVYINDKLREFDSMYGIIKCENNIKSDYCNTYIDSLQVEVRKYTDIMEVVKAIEYWYHDLLPKWIEEGKISRP